MKNLKHILLFFIIVGCGAKKSQSSKAFELSEIKGSENILETSKDTLSFEKWSWLQKRSFKVYSEDPEQSSSVQFDEKTNTLNFKNAVIEGEEESENNKETTSKGKNTTTDRSKNDKTTNITDSEVQSESRKQWKFKVWHLAPLLAVIGVVYLIFNHKNVLIKIIKNIFSK